MLAFADIITAAAFRSDLQNTNRVLQAEWIALVNAALDSVWNILAGSRPDFQVASYDVTLVSGLSASFATPPDFHSMIDVVFGPDTAQEYSLGPFNWVNRRSPGGWYFPLYVGAGVPYGASAARLMGTQIYVEPSLRAGGTYRLWYCPRAHTAWIVRLATTAALPTCTAAGSGPGKTLTATANGALSVDGVAVNVNDLILVQNQAASGDNGVYIVTASGGTTAAFALTRWQGANQATELAVGSVVGVGQSNAALPTGAVNEGQFFTLTAFTAIESAQAWSLGAAIDLILEPFAELIAVKTTVPAMLRDARGAVAAPFIAAQKTLEDEAANYFARTRSPGPQRMIDTDSQLFGWGNGWR